ncbi:MAG: hypothetical protein NZM28_10385 [Fimbriimonadales bacterium]|nr:hypothetical protein [Fimbriimonadales bacterium]
MQAVSFSLWAGRMMIAYILLHAWLAIGLLFEIANLCWYAIGIWKLSRLQPGQKRPYIPSAVPFVSLPIYLSYCLLITVYFEAVRKPLTPMPFELKLGLALIVGHIVFHLVMINPTCCLSESPRLRLGMTSSLLPTERCHSERCEESRPLKVGQ